MNKFFTKIGVAMVGIVMAIGVGVGVAVASSTKEATPVSAASPVEITLSTTGCTAAGYDNGKERTWTQDGTSFGAVYLMKSSTNMQFQKNNAKVYNKTAMGGTITGITLTVGSGSARNWSLKLGTSRDNVTAVSGYNASSSGWSTISGSYTFFEIHSPASGASYLSKISVTYSSGTIAVTGVTVAPTAASLGVGDKQQLTPTVLPENASNKNVSYSSNATNVATVDENGLVTAVGVGSATITVTTEDGNKTATCAVTVTAALIHATINGSDAGSVGTQWTPTSITEDESGNTVTGATYAFAASNGAVISSSSTSTGAFTCSASGTVTVSATKSGYTIASKTVTVSYAEPAHITNMSISEIASIGKGNLQEKAFVYEITGYVTELTDKAYTYGNFYIADEKDDTDNQVYVYGCTEDGNKMSFDTSTGLYSYASSKTNAESLDGKLLVGSKITAHFIALYYNSTFELQGIIKSVTNDVDVTSVSISGTGISENELSIGSSDTSAHTINVTLDPSNATDQKVNIAHQDGTNGLFTKSASQITCSSGSGSFTLTGTGATSGSETFRISANTQTDKYVDLVVTALDDSIVYHTVTFNSNGGSLTPAVKQVEHNTSFEFPSPGTKEHHSFLGWSSNGGTNKYATGTTSLAVVADIAYTAYWQEDAKATVTYTAGTNCTGSFAHTLQYIGDYELLAVGDLDGITYDSTTYRFKDYTVGGQSKTSGDTVTLPAGGLTVTVNFELIPDETTVSTTIADYAANNGWTTTSQYTLMTLDTNVSVTVTGGGNSGKYYSSANPEDWRLYSSENATLTITATNGCELSSVTLTFSNTDSPTVKHGDDTITSGAAVTASGTSIVFSVTSGKLHISEISVTYTGSSSVVSYTISYNKNAEDATETMSPTTGADPAVAACTFKYEGYTFARWNTQADGEGDDYAVGAKPGKDLELYAIWQEEIEPIGAHVTMDVDANASAAKVNGHDAIKCGTGSKKGSMTLTLNESGITHIKFYAAAWGGDTTNKTVNVSIDSGSVSVDSITLTNDSGIANNSPFTLSGDETDYRFDLTLTNAPQGAVITLEANTASNNRFVVWGATDLFAETFASEFMTGLTCNAAGTSAPTFKTGYSWSSLEALYNGLDAEEQGILKDADANEGGTQVEQAMARYDYIEGKYNPTNSSTSAWKNFIGRSVTPVANSSILINTIIGTESGNTALIIVISTMISGLAIGGYFFLKRRKPIK